MVLLIHSGLRDDVSLTKHIKRHFTPPSSQVISLALMIQHLQALSYRSSECRLRNIPHEIGEYMCGYQDGSGGVDVGHCVPALRDEVWTEGVGEHAGGYQV